ncbi:hypothetical protein TWF173_000580 [Orbilia oligospora]|uniref:Uncharacterized protein n=2 Tax=Orbilia oligospora TaxID=2813651 RepID=G1XHK0_ARTOA|nr:hypothetical protein AOL_s00083g481 [Orbilia oligospora ATCC 24927]EGX47388.1 hypothetical protein AOL_s00083g481 [Orbilia oligospora ATCC 24927]KAF3271376.1 hypothetical protein TWF970_010258 [Orbilia oligospora]KAF3308991.1 hypothetical protein TWF173_000580 [Orbilia oligospora]
MADADHPKVRLDTIAEYKTVLNRVEQLSRDKLAQHFPPSANSSIKDETYRKRVEELVAEYVRRLLDLANQNISINGNDIGDVDSVLKAEEEDQYEPYDDKLRVRVNDLIAKVGTATGEVAKLRREVPKRAAAAYEKKLKADIDREVALAEAALKENENTMDIDDEGGTDVVDWGIKPLARQKEVEKAWENAVGLLPSLKKMDGPLTRAQGQVAKAQQVLEHIQQTK